ncbi:MAG: hypothetical protein QM652_14165 [Legionella sp.]|uniref:hypothetical protein n=1 Tax=Legionella sp. TaxID=459 RepID=UPI0039E529FC
MKPIIKDLSVVFLIGLIFLWSFLAAIERLIFFNTNQYPDFLVYKTISLGSKEKRLELIKLIYPQDYINASILFEPLEKEFIKIVKVYNECLVPRETLRAQSLFSIIHVLQEAEGIRLTVNETH